MPWSVRIEDEEHKPVSGEDIVLEFQMLDNLPSDWLMLRGIDRYQDTTFNSTQLEHLLYEWEKLGTRLADAAERAVWEKVRGYINRCLDGVHLYLKFIGD